MAGVGVQRSRTDGKAHTGHPNRTMIHTRHAFGMPPYPKERALGNGFFADAQNDRLEIPACIGGYMVL